VVSASGLAPSALVLEMTESVLLRRDDRIRADLTELKNIGIRLAIDDCGTGLAARNSRSGVRRRCAQRHASPSVIAAISTQARYPPYCVLRRIVTWAA
jgi:EAL domain